MRRADVAGAPFSELMVGAMLVAALATIIAAEIAKRRWKRLAMGRRFRNLTAAVLSALVPVGPAVALQAPHTEEPSAMLLAQAHDRCMAEYAVGLTHTSAADEAIYSQAASGCEPIKARLFAAIARDLPPSEATELMSAFDAQAKPNFLTLLQRIKTDRLATKQD